MLKSARTTAEKIASLSALTVQGTKRVMKFSEEHSPEDSLEYVALWNSTFLKSPDLVRKKQFKIF